MKKKTADTTAKADKPTLKEKILKVFSVFFLIGFILAQIPILSNAYIFEYSKKYILTVTEAAELNVDCVLVLGAGVRADGSVSYMLKDRLDKGVELFKAGASSRLLMTGDHGRDDYDEVNAMKSYAKSHGVESDSVFMDHAGFSTYESMYRARDVFCVKSAIVVTQAYHIYRAVYDARMLGIEAYGVIADEYDYSFKYDAFNNAREFLARTKDFFWCIIKPAPTYLGDSIPISSSGALTDDNV